MMNRIKMIFDFLLFAATALLSCLAVAFLALTAPFLFLYSLILDILLIGRERSTWRLHAMSQNAN